MKTVVACTALSLTDRHPHCRIRMGEKDDYPDAVEACAEQYTDPDDVQ